MTKEQSYTRFWEGSKRMWITFLFFSFIMIGFVQAANTAFAQINSYCKCAGRHFK